MAFPILGTPKPQFFDSSGSPLVSGTLSVLDPADDTNKASYPTYDDAGAATNANDNPMTLNSRGEPASGLWGKAGEDYKLVLKDSSGTTIYTIDDIFLPEDFAAGSKTLGFPTTEARLTGSIPQAVIGVQAYTRTATVVESRTLAANASATAANNNSVLAALIADLQQKGIIT